jgi:hypothetical protein
MGTYPDVCVVFEIVPLPKLIKPKNFTKPIVVLPTMNCEILSIKIYAGEFFN